VLIAFGLGAVIGLWAKERGARALLGPGGVEFLAALVDALDDPSNAFIWQLVTFKPELAAQALHWYDAGDLNRCGFTNWEYLTFWYRPKLWSRTTWWVGETEVDNPLENWL
jgi:hypothetical protein